MDEIRKTILTRAQLAERGVDNAYTMPDEDFEDIANRVFDCFGVDEHLSEAIELVMKTMDKTM